MCCSEPEMLIDNGFQVCRNCGSLGQQMFTGSVHDVHKLPLPLFQYLRIVRFRRALKKYDFTPEQQFELKKCFVRLETCWKEYRKLWRRTYFPNLRTLIYCLSRDLFNLNLTRKYGFPLKDNNRHLYQARIYTRLCQLSKTPIDTQDGVNQTYIPQPLTPAELTTLSSR